MNKSVPGGPFVAALVATFIAARTASIDASPAETAQSPRSEGGGAGSRMSPPSGVDLNVTCIFRALLYRAFNLEYLYFANSIYPITPQGASLRARINTIGVMATDPGADGERDGGWYLKGDVRLGASGWYGPEGGASGCRWKPTSGWSNREVRR